jgi:hypothetical protein
MSSLNRDDDGDQKKPSDSPWANAEQQQDETLRLQQEVIAAAQQLERQSHGLAFRDRPPLQLETARPKFELATLRPREDRFSLQEYRHGSWTTLDPVPMPPPPQDKISLASPGMIVGLVGAVGLAAAIALAIVHTLDIRPASPVMSVSAETEPSKSRSFASIADNLPRMASPEVKVVKPAELAAAATASVLAAVPTNEAALAKPSIMAPPPSPTTEAVAVAKVEPAQPETPKPAPSAIPEPRPADSLSREEIASLLKRGQDMIATGDIASGRLFLTRAALAGDAEASLALAGTYDAAVLANLKAVGVQPDPAKARAWYTRAAEQGSEEAKVRLQQSALR